VFFLVIAPIAIFFRLIGRDALDRRLDPNATSYWTPLEQDTQPSRYFRQF